MGIGPAAGQDRATCLALAGPLWHPRSRSCAAVLWRPLRDQRPSLVASFASWRLLRGSFGVPLSPGAGFVRSRSCSWWRWDRFGHGRRWPSDSDAARCTHLPHAAPCVCVRCCLLTPLVFAARFSPLQVPSQSPFAVGTLPHSLGLARLPVGDAAGVTLSCKPLVSSPPWPYPDGPRVWGEAFKLRGNPEAAAPAL